jgi:hypothetical protein
VAPFYIVILIKLNNWIVLHLRSTWNARISCGAVKASGGAFTVRGSRKGFSFLFNVTRIMQAFLFCDAISMQHKYRARRAGCPNK